MYANKHNYALTIDYEVDNSDVLSRRNPVWHKLNMIEDAIDRIQREESSAKWIWWLDWDTVITNTTIRLEDIVDEALVRYNGEDPGDVEMVMTKDWFVFPQYYKLLHEYWY